MQRHLRRRFASIRQRLYDGLTLHCRRLIFASNTTNNTFQSSIINGSMSGPLVNTGLNIYAAYYHAMYATLRCLRLSFSPSAAMPPLRAPQHATPLMTCRFRAIVRHWFSLMPCLRHMPPPWCPPCRRHAYCFIWLVLMPPLLSPDIDATMPPRHCAAKTHIDAADGHITLLRHAADISVRIFRRAMMIRWCCRYYASASRRACQDVLPLACRQIERAYATLRCWRCRYAWLRCCCCRAISFTMPLRRHHITICCRHVAITPYRCHDMMTGDTPCHAMMLSDAERDIIERRHVYFLRAGLMARHERATMPLTPLSAPMTILRRWAATHYPLWARRHRCLMMSAIIYEFIYCLIRLPPYVFAAAAIELRRCQRLYATPRWHAAWIFTSHW